MRKLDKEKLLLLYDDYVCKMCALSSIFGVNIPTPDNIYSIRNLKKCNKKLD